MTRDKVIKELLEVLHLETADPEVSKCFGITYVKINEIFDYFENRICKNCIHYDKDDKVCILLDMGVLDNTFGCKEFKENK